LEADFNMKEDCERLAPRESARDRLSIGLPAEIAVRAVVAGARLTRIWQRPRKTEGDYPNMSLLDQFHWLYKVEHPLERPERGHPLDWHPSPLGDWSLPVGFKKETEVVLAAVGDLLANEHLTAPGTDLYGEIEGTLFDADISFGNLEGPLVRAGHSQVALSYGEAPSLSISLAQFAVLQGPGERRFDLLSTANNHSLDLGSEGVRFTLDRLMAERICALGTNRSVAEFGQGNIVDLGAAKIGFVSATFGLNGKTVPKGEEFAVNVVRLNRVDGEVDLSLLESQVRDCRDRGADAIVASLHWGLEHEFFPTTLQTDLARRLIDLDIDVILGHHPHVIQPLQRLERTSVGRGPGLVFYSLGNFSSPIDYVSDTLSLLARVTFAVGSVAGHRRAVIQRVEAIPVLQLTLERREVRRLQVVRLEDLLRGGVKYTGLELVAREAERYAKLVLGDDFLRC